MADQPTFLLGIDGGGTKTSAVLADRQRHVLAQAGAGPANPNTIGIEASAARCAELLRTCLAAVRSNPRQLAAAVFGIAGAGSVEVQHALSAALESTLGHPIPLTITSDAHIALEGALCGEPGIAVIAGTGSVVLAKSAAGELRFHGGWGRTLGDEGSGYAIGVDAVRMVLRDLESPGESDALAGLLAAQRGWTARSNVLFDVYQAGFDLASLAPLVIDLAARGDLPCQQLLHRQAVALAATVAAAAPEVGEGRVTVATCGGLIDTSNLYRMMLKKAIEENAANVHVAFPKMSPVQGALLLAAEKLKGDGECMRA